MSDVAFQVYAEVGISSPIAVNPPIGTQRWLLVLADVMELVRSMVATNIAASTTVHARPNVTLVPTSRWRVHALNLGFPHHPFVSVSRAKIDQARLIDDAEVFFDQHKPMNVEPCLTSDGDASFP